VASAEASAAQISAAQTGARDDGHDGAAEARLRDDGSADAGTGDGSGATAWAARDEAIRGRADRDGVPADRAGPGCGFAVRVGTGDRVRWD
jgi:hypothetical protein